MDDDLRQFAGLFDGYLPGRTADADRRKHALAFVAYRRADAQESWLVLALVQRIPSLPRPLQFRQQRRTTRDRALGERLEAEFDHPVDHFPRLVSQDRLADAGAIGRRVLDQRRRSGDVARRLQPPNDDCTQPVEHGEMDRQVGQALQRLDERRRLAVQIEIGQYRVAELEQADAEAVIAALPILVEEADLPHRGQEPVGRAAGIVEHRADLGQRQGPAIGRETAQDRSRLGEGLEVLLLRPAPGRDLDFVLHAKSSAAFRPTGNMTVFR